MIKQLRLSKELQLKRSKLNEYRETEKQLREKTNNFKLR